VVSSGRDIEKGNSQFVHLSVCLLSIEHRKERPIPNYMNHTKEVRVPKVPHLNTR